MFSEEKLQLLSVPARQQVCYYAFYDSEKQVYVLSGDDRFTNHSGEPSTQNEGYDSYGIRDIQAGEERSYWRWGEAAIFCLLGEVSSCESFFTTFTGRAGNCAADNGGDYFLKRVSQQETFSNR